MVHFFMPPYRPPRLRHIWQAGLLAALVVLAGCTPAHYRKSADREVYRAIAGKSGQVRNMDEHFTIEHTNEIVLAGLPLSTNAEEFLGKEGESEQGASIISLEKALDIGVHHSRDYQNHKEELYVSALDLTGARHKFTPIFGADASGTYLSDNVAETHQVDSHGGINVSWLIRDVGKITTAFTTDFTRYIFSSGQPTAKSEVVATFVSPLLRDAGYKNDTEALTLAERGLLYDLRNFAQYRKDFSVGVAQDYYNVLGNRDAARNSYLNLLSTRKNAERTEAMAAEGRTTTAELGRYKQAALVAESSWINSVRTYKQSLDDFKLKLGLKADLNIILDDHELDALQIEHPEISVEDSIRVALTGRLDFQNTRDAYDDAIRNLKLKEDALKPQLNLSSSVTVDSDPNVTSHFSLPDPNRYQWSAGLDLDPGLDKQEDRNIYRAALIACDRAARTVEEKEDSIKLEVRDSWRTLDQAKRNYEINDISVKLAERRVEEQDLLAEVGRARAQDQVDAQNDLINSKNQRTQALVTHTIARLQFWNNMGILYIKDNGQWKETQDEKNN